MVQPLELVVPPEHCLLPVQELSGRCPHLEQTRHPPQEKQPEPELVRSDGFRSCFILPFLIVLLGLGGIVMHLLLTVPLLVLTPRAAPWPPRWDLCHHWPRHRLALLMMGALVASLGHLPPLPLPLLALTWSLIASPGIAATGTTAVGVLGSALPVICSPLSSCLVCRLVFEGRGGGTRS